MFDSKASVVLRKEATDEGYTLTIYMGIEADSGPDNELVLMESVNDLYKYFNTYDESDSYRMAEFCLLKGYKVLAQRVNIITGPSACRKFIKDGESLFFSPRQGIDYSEPFTTTFTPTISYDSASYSEIVTFNSLDFAEGTLVNDNFLIISPRLVYDQMGMTSSESFFLAVLAGQSVSDQELTSRFSNSPSIVNVTKLNKSVTASEFKEILLDFFERSCAFEVEQIENTESSYLLLSATNISDITCENCYLQSDTQQNSLVSFALSDIGGNDNYCRYYNDYQVATFYSKVPSAIDDIRVEVTLSNGYYYVYVYKNNLEGIPILSESFQYLPKNLKNISDDSELVTLEISDSDADLSGIYQLAGQERIDESTDFTKSINVIDGQSPYNVDIVVDNNDDSISRNRRSYIESLRVAYPNSLIFTDLVGVEGKQIVQIGPNVTWRDTGYTMRGSSYLLYLLPEYDMGRDETIIKITPDEDFDSTYYDNVIVERDYGVALIGVKTKLESVFPIKSLLSVVCFENLITQELITSEASFYALVQNSIDTVNNYLGTSTEVQVTSYVNSNGKVVAELTIKANKFIISSFRVETMVTW